LGLAAPIGNLSILFYRFGDLAEGGAVGLLFGAISNEITISSSSWLTQNLLQN